MPHALRVIACILVLLPMTHGSAWGLSLGRVSDASVLGGPLDFSVALQLAPGEALSSECVSAEVLFGEARVAPSQVHAVLQRGSDATVQAVRIRTDARVDEPVATITLKLGCPARLVRQFVALVDPPLVADAPGRQSAQGSSLQDLPHDASMAAQFRSAAAGSSASAAASGAPIELPGAADAPRGDGSGAATPSAKRQRPAPPKAAGANATPRTTRPAAASRPARTPAGAPVLAPRPAADGASSVAPAKQKPPTPARPAAQPEGRAPTSRLSLDPPDPRAAAPASAAAASGASSGASGASDAALSASQSAQDRAAAERRLAALEASLGRLQAENETNRARMLTLQARLQQAESARYANPLVFVLLALVLLLAAGLVFSLKRQQRLKLQRPPWWDPSAMPSSHADSSLQSRFDDPVPAMTPQDVWPTQAPSLSRSRPVASGPAAAAKPASPPATAPSSATAPMPLAADVSQAIGLSLEPPRRPVAVEELIDLEQQAEFFRVLGQEQSAIELLMGHLRESGAGSPMPYLKLLDIHRRRGDRDDYERIRTRFNERFSAYAPEWGSDLGAGRSLENYPDVLAELQRLWIAPKQAMERLETLMFRHDAADTTFELPAYLQLLFLFSVARDLAESEIDPTQVDLLLPIAADEGGPSAP